MRSSLPLAALVPLLLLSAPAHADTDEVGIVRDGMWCLDANGDNHAGAGDSLFYFGLATDKKVWGDFNGDGHDEVGIVRDGMWCLDTNGDNHAGPGDSVFYFGLPTDQPVVGDWSGLGYDQVGIFRNGRWFLDTNGNFQADAGDATFVFGVPGDVPIVFGCTTCGVDYIGIFRNGLWFLDVNPNYRADQDDIYFNFGRAGDVPVVGDWVGFGADQVGIFRNGLWFLDTTPNFIAEGTDTFFYFGLPTDQPVAGAYGGCGDPTSGDCGVNNGTAFCDDENCCATVCATDPYCCETSWDDICADEASQLCGATGYPDVLGLYTGGHSVSLSGCQDPANNGFYVADSMVLEIFYQENDHFSGVYDWDIYDLFFWEEGDLFGTVDESGFVTGYGYYVDYLDGFYDSEGEFTFTGNLSGDTLNLNFIFQDTAGDTCSGTGTSALIR